MKILTALFLGAVGIAGMSRSSGAEAKREGTGNDNRIKAQQYFSLGETYQDEGKLEQALEAYVMSSRLQNHMDPEAAKRAATCNDWMRQYASARSWLQTSLKVRPNDEQALQSLQGLEARRSLHVFGSLGGWEVDFASRAHELGVFIGWVDWLDGYAGYTRTDRAFYQRTTLWMDAYLFPEYRTFLRVGLRERRYSYPASINPNPDHNAYAQVPDIQLEAGYTFDENRSVSVELEYFRPNFFWNTDLRADNFKIGGNIGGRIYRPVYARVFAALLRDPDPGTFVVDPRSNTVRSFGYESLGLLGATLGYDDGSFRAEVKYVPNRDLDKSMDWSLFAQLGYRWKDLGLQYDMLYDRFLNAAYRGFSVSRVHMLTLELRPIPTLDIRGGLKTLMKESIEVAPFLSFRYKTGL